MALANGLAQEGHPPTKLETDAVCTLDQTDAGFRITTMQLTVRGEVDGIGEDEFQRRRTAGEGGLPGLERARRRRDLDGGVAGLVGAALDPASGELTELAAELAVAVGGTLRRRTRFAGTRTVPSSVRTAHAERVSPSSGMPTLPGLSSSVPSGPGRRNCWWLWPKTTSRSRTPASIRSSSGSGCGAKLSTSESGEPWT